MIMRCDIARGWARCHNKERAIHVHLVNAITVNMATFMGMRAGCGLKERCKNMVEQGTRWLKNYTFKQTIQARPSLTLQKSERRSPAEVA